MKLSLSIKLLTIFMILHQISCDIPEGYVLVKNLTGSTSMGVFNLGLITIDDMFVTANSLIGETISLILYQPSSLRTPLNQYTLTAFQTDLYIALPSSVQPYYLAVKDRIPKLVIEVLDDQGMTKQVIDQNAHGDFSSVSRTFSFKNDCTFYVDRFSFSAPYLDDGHQVQVKIKDVNGQFSSGRSKIFSEDTNLANSQFQVLAGESATIYIPTSQIPINPATFEFGFPIYSPSDKKCQIEQTYACSSSDTKECHIFNGYKCGTSNNNVCESVCGDNIVVTGQDCDGVTGCDSCKAATDYLCFPSNNTCTKCGNGKVDDATEDCDNGNKEGCVGCKVAPGYKCPLVDGKSACYVCNTNNVLEAGEECDNGGKASCKDCKIVSPFKCKNTLGKPSLCFICGNSLYQQGEECDNGNSTGCINCTLDRGFTCKRKLNAVSNCTNICGDGLWVTGEECDNGNQTGCINCVITAGYTCRGPKYTTSKCISCGNYIVEWPEQCDNNNANGCKDCKIQTGWNCRANPKYCYRIVQVCGNGEREIEEDCDDGNKVNGDGCSSLCKKETGYTCTEALGEKTTCSLVTP